MPAQLNHLAATGYGDALQVASDASRRNGDLIEEQMAVRRASAAAPGAKLTKVGDLTYWASVQDGRYKADNFGQTRFESDRSGLVAGVDKPMTDGNIAGVAVGYSADRVRSPELGSAIDTDLITVAGYYGWTSGSVYIDSRAGVSRAHYSSDRSLYSISPSASGSGSGWGINGSSTIGYRYDAGGLQLLPETGLQVDIISRGGLTENRGGATALAVDGDTISSVRSKLGLRIEGATRFSDGYSLTLALRAHWMYEMGNQDVTTSAAFVQARNGKMHVLSVASDRSSGLVGGGLNLSMPNNMSLWAHYNAELAGNTSSQGASLGLRWAW
jgi:outer membrane autotransporter protein